MVRQRAGSAHGLVPRQVKRKRYQRASLDLDHATLRAARAESKTWPQKSVGLSIEYSRPRSSQPGAFLCGLLSHRSIFYSWHLFLTIAQLTARQYNRPICPHLRCPAASEVFQSGTTWYPCYV